jgi:ketosteroid isomerase-like protein
MSGHELTQEDANIRLVRDYFAAVQRGAADHVLAMFYAPDVVQEEFPNRFLPNGATRDLQALEAAAERGCEMMAAQELELLNIVASGSHVAVEARWAGTLAKAIGPIPAGTVMRARFGQFFEIRDGRIVRQRNYDCFEPW